ncbi:kelch repeat-containing protein [Paenibacillus sp. MER TA 81-3]|uniref:Kelch repeat-containing protein n=1 Tax=Paenibacillus sp. MER TA 81-3 TaxID=2939573 RepID=UPI00203BCB91|nr:kelch repeat-containing protein [Paenibacillus sp. MER TA 81-3]
MKFLTPKETITTLKDLTFPRTEHTSVQMNGNIYIIGGAVFENDGILSTVEMYSVESPEPEPEPKPDQPKGDRAILVVTISTFAA